MAQKIYEIDYPETNLEDFLIEDDGATPVYVLPIGTILYRGDSQINNPLKNLKGIRQGKHFEIEVDETDQNLAEKKVNQMCEKLLVNLIIEDYKINRI